MRYALCATQAPHASYRNGLSGADARQYFLRKTARLNNGPRIAPAIIGLGPGELRLVWNDVSGELLQVRSPDNNNGYQTLDWTPFAAWDEGTRQIISGGLRIMRKIKAYSDRTGDWREADMPAALGRLTGSGHWYGNTVSDGAGTIYLHNVGEYKYNPATGVWTALAVHVTTNGSNGSSMVWVPSLFSGAGGLIKYGGDARRWLIYNPATDTWPTYTDGLPCGQHAILAYHATFDKVLMVGGTGTETVAALVTPSTGAFTLVASAPASIAMDTSDWMVAHPDGCWLLRSGVAGRMYAYWPGTDTWEDKGAAPDSALSTPQAAFDAARSTVYITSDSGLYAYALPVYGPRSGAIDTVDGGDNSAITASSAGSVTAVVSGTVAHAGVYHAAASVAAPSAGIGVTVAATVMHAGAFSASAVVTVGISVTVGGTVVHAGSYSAAASTGAPPPFLEPVTLAEAKTAARLELSDVGMDSLIEGLITMAREQAEQITGRLYRDTTERVELTDWPASTDVLYVAEPRAVAIAYWDGAAWASLDGSAFEWAGQGAGTVIAPAVGGSWPALGVRAVGARVRVDITAGPTSASQVAESVKLYIKALVSVWINNPDAAQRGAMQTNPMFDRLLDRERLWH